MSRRSSRSELPVLDGRWCDETERRTFQRVPTRLPAMLISSALGRVRTTVTDLSQTGCRITTRAKCHPGDLYVLTIDGTGPRAVRVAWARDGDAGLVFAVPLGWGIVSALAMGGAVD